MRRDIGDGPDTYLTNRARYPSEAELEELRRTWPTSASDITGCADPWVAPAGGFGAACVEKSDEGS
jgi:hypothetical protein